MRYYKETNDRVYPIQYAIHERGRGSDNAPRAISEDSVFVDRIVDLLNADEAREGR